MGERRTELEIERDAYGAYLIARATGKQPYLREKTAVTALDRYAVALGVHHFHRGTKPVSFRTLLDRAEAACHGMGDLGPSPPDPGETGEPQPAGIAQDSHRFEVERLADYLEQHFPAAEPRQGETAVDVAVQLLDNLVVHYQEIEKVRALREQLERDFPDEFPLGHSAVGAARKLLSELKDARKLSAESQPLARDAVQWERRACVEFLRSFTHPQPPTQLAELIEAGKHRPGTSSPLV